MRNNLLTEENYTPDTLVDCGPSAPPRTRNWLPRESHIIFGLPASIFLQVALFTTIACSRFIDNDEGLYLLAAKLVAQGKRPYFDFFFQQMPAMPYVYALWSRVAGFSWTSARMLSVLFSVALGGLLYWHVEQLYSRRTLACLAVLLYALNNLIIAWHSVVKTYALSNFLLFCGYLLVFHDHGRYRGYKAFLGGLVLALAVDTRLYFIAVAPALMAAVYLSGSRREWRLKYICPFLCGLGLGLLPNAFFLSRAPDAYLFDNIRYHLIRHHSGIGAGIRQKIETFLILTNVRGSYDGSGAQFLLLSLPALAVVLWRGFDRRLLLPLAISLILFFTCLLPRPTFSQYFCVCVPYLVIIAVDFFVAVSRDTGPSAQLLKRLGVLTAGLYLLSGAVTFYNYGYWGTAVEGIGRRENAVDYRISTVNQVSKVLGTLASDHTPVISFWPGYLAECDCVPQPGTENEFALWISPKITAEEADRWKIITAARVTDLLKTHSAKVVVVRSRDGGGWGLEFRDVLQESGYKLFRSIGRAEIYLWSTPRGSDLQ